MTDEMDEIEEKITDLNLKVENLLKILIKDLESKRKGVSFDLEDNLRWI